MCSATENTNQAEEQATVYTIIVRSAIRHGMERVTAKRGQEREMEVAKMKMHRLPFSKAS